MRIKVLHKKGEEPAEYDVEWVEVDNYSGIKALVIHPADGCLKIEETIAS